MTGREVAEELIIDPAATAELIEQFIQRKVQESGFQRVVLGLSGGADSAVVAALCTRALGSENVHPYLLPCATSSAASRIDAEQVAERLGLTPEVIDISDITDAYFGDRDLSPLRKGNVFARVRMLILFDMAAKRNALVAGTSNKTETCLGYSTWYGDSACSFQPVADLYKTQLWQLASWMRLPERVIEKVPSADLWPGQTDEDELGFTYAAADQILYGLLNRNLSSADLVDRGADRDVVKRILQIIRSTQYKRQMPAVATLSSDAIGTDVLLLRDSGPERSL